MHWKTKSSTFRIINYFPLSQDILYRLQRHITKEIPRKDYIFERLLIAAKKIKDEVDNTRETSSPAHYVEIGAGRDLALAIALRMLGVEKITCIDLFPLAKPYLIQKAASYLSKKLSVPLPSIKTLSDLEDFGIHYVAPSSLANANIHPNSVDVFYTTDTLEHIPRDALRLLIGDISTILKPQGLCINFIDYSDHYARSDNSISPFNFLKYSEQDWSKHNTPLHFVNRMRHSEYISLFSENNFIILQVSSERAKPPENLVISQEFQDFETPDIFTVRAKITCQKPR